MKTMDLITVHPRLSFSIVAVTSAPAFLDRPIELSVCADSNISHLPGSQDLVDLYFAVSLPALQTQPAGPSCIHPRRVDG